jgi:hypothetical protein
VLPRIAYRQAQRTYLKLLLSREVGSNYTAVGEESPEKHCEELPLEGVLEVISCR